MSDFKHVPPSSMGAYRVIQEDFKKLDPKLAAFRTGAEYDEAAGTLKLMYLGQWVKVHVRDCTCEWQEPEFTSHMDNQILLHHILVADGSLPSGEKLSLFEIAPPSSGWAARIQKTCLPPVADMFGDDMPLLFQTAERMGGKAVSNNTVEIFATPHIPVYFTIHTADEEFPAEAVMLLDKTFPRQLPGEDKQVLPELAAYELLRYTGKPFHMPVGEFRK